MNVIMTIYSNNYDMYSYVVGRGMSGKVFIENGKSGKEFPSVSEAFDYAVKRGVELNEIVYCYQENGHQLFKRFEINNPHVADFI